MRFIFNFLCFACFCNPPPVVFVGGSSYNCDIAQWNAENSTLTIKADCIVRHESNNNRQKIFISFIPWQYKLVSNLDNPFVLVEFDYVYIECDTKGLSEDFCKQLKFQGVIYADSFDIAKHCLRDTKIICGNIEVNTNFIVNCFVQRYGFQTKEEFEIIAQLYAELEKFTKDTPPLNYNLINKIKRLPNIHDIIFDICLSYREGFDNNILKEFILSILMNTGYFYTISEKIESMKEDAKVITIFPDDDEEDEEDTDADQYSLNSYKKYFKDYLDKKMNKSDMQLLHKDKFLEFFTMKEDAVNDYVFRTQICVFLSNIKLIDKKITLLEYANSVESFSSSGLYEGSFPSSDASKVTHNFVVQFFINILNKLMSFFGWLKSFFIK